MIKKNKFAKVNYVNSYSIRFVTALYPQTGKNKILKAYLIFCRVEQYSLIAWTDNSIVLSILNAKCRALKIVVFA